MDFITVLPMYRILSGFIKRARFFLLLKLTRLYRGIQLLDTAMILRQLKSAVKRHLDTIVASGDKEANDRTNNHNYIGHIVLIGHLIRTLKLIIIMLVVSYLFAIAWYIFCGVVLEDTPP